MAYCLLREVPVLPSASEILEGYGVFRTNTRVYHTYVRSSAGDDWGCHGWPTGGQQLCAGPGSISVAHCIDGKDDAGIFYMRTGLCHQIANRILSPAGIDYLRAAMFRSGVLTLLGANLGAIMRGFRRHIAGRTESSGAKPRSREPLPVLRVLVPGIIAE